MEIDLLRIFLTVAQENSLTEASKKLNTVQSNISARLKLLEEEVGQPLFLRSKKGMFLTEAGERLKPMASELLQKSEDIKIEMKKEQPVGHVTLGVPESFLRTYLRKPLGKWVNDHPLAKVKLKTGFSHEITALLENREIDFGVIISKDRPKQFHVLKEFQSELVVVTPKSVSELSKNSISNFQPMLSGDSCFFGQAVMQLTTNLGIDPHGFNYVHSIESIIHCISVGIGYSVLPKCLMEKHPLKNELSLHKYVGKNHFSYFKICLSSRKNTKLVKEISKYL